VGLQFETKAEELTPTVKKLDIRREAAGWYRNNSIPDIFLKF
jgi:hypothetical protein